MSALASLLLALGPSTLDVSLASEHGKVLMTVHAEGVPAHELLAEIAFRSGLALESPDPLPDHELTVELVRRPLEQVVRYVLGAAGLRGHATDTAIVAEPDVPLGAEEQELEHAAQAEYSLALRRWPRHAQAAAAELALGEIQEARGELAAARVHYDLVVEEHRHSDLVPEALWRSGRLLQRLGRWSEAWTELGELVSAAPAHPYGVRARLELVHVSLELGDPRQAEYLLDALERDFPAETDDDLRERLIARAEIALRTEAPLDALRLLDQADRVRAAETLDPSAEPLRARALEAAGRPDEAGRVWLQVASSSEGEPRTVALQSAARLALAAGDDLAVLFVEGHARELGLGDVVAEWTASARQRLGLVDARLADSGAAERAPESAPESALERAERLAAQGLWQPALTALDAPLAEPLRLDVDERLRALLLYADAAAELDQVDLALAKLRALVGTFEHDEQRSRLYLRAGDLLEGRGRFEEAAAAYGGKL